MASSSQRVSFAQNVSISEYSDNESEYEDSLLSLPEDDYSEYFYEHDNEESDDYDQMEDKRHTVKVNHGELECTQDKIDLEFDVEADNNDDYEEEVISETEEEEVMANQLIINDEKQKGYDGNIAEIGCMYEYENEYAYDDRDGSNEEYDNESKNESDELNSDFDKCHQVESSGIEKYMNQAKHDHMLDKSSRNNMGQPRHIKICKNWIADRIDNKYTNSDEKTWNNTNLYAQGKVESYKKDFESKQKARNVVTNKELIDQRQKHTQKRFVKKKKSMQHGTPKKKISYESDTKENYEKESPERDLVGTQKNIKTGNIQEAIKRENAEKDALIEQIQLNSVLFEEAQLDGHVGTKLSTTNINRNPKESPHPSSNFKSKENSALTEKMKEKEDHDSEQCKGDERDVKLTSGKSTRYGANKVEEQEHSAHKTQELKYHLAKLDRQLHMIEVKRISQLADLEEETTSCMREYRSKLQHNIDRKRKAMIKKKEMMQQQSIQSQGLSGSLRQSNQKLRAESKKIEQSIETLKEKNRRLQDENSHRGLYLEQMNRILSMEVSAASELNKQLRQDVPKYEKLIGAVKESLNTANKFGEMEHKVKKMTMDCINKISGELKESNCCDPALMDKIDEMIRIIDMETHAAFERSVFASDGFVEVIEDSPDQYSALDPDALANRHSAYPMKKGREDMELGSLSFANSIPIFSSPSSNVAFPIIS